MIYWNISFMYLVCISVEREGFEEFLSQIIPLRPR